MELSILPGRCFLLPPCRRPGTSAWKSGRKACWGDKMWKQLAGATFGGDQRQCRVAPLWNSKLYSCRGVLAGTESGPYTVFCACYRQTGSKLGPRARSGARLLPPQHEWHFSFCQGCCKRLELHLLADTHICVEHQPWGEMSLDVIGGLLHYPWRNRRCHSCRGHFPPCSSLQFAMDHLGIQWSTVLMAIVYIGTTRQCVGHSVPWTSSFERYLCCRTWFWCCYNRCYAGSVRVVVVVGKSGGIIKADPKLEGRGRR